MSEIPEVFAIFEQKLAHVLSFNLRQKGQKKAIEELLVYFSGIVERASKAEARIAELERDKEALSGIKEILREHIEVGTVQLSTATARIAELEGLVDEFIAASSNLLPYTNVLNPYDGIRVPYWALKKLVQRARKEREIPCKHCHGTGTVYLEGSIHGEDICPKCHGTGIKERER